MQKCNDRNEKDKSKKTISLFFVFKNISIRHNKLINRIAGSVFGIYMIHDQQNVRSILAHFVSELKKSFEESGILLIGGVLGIIVLVFLTGSIIELCRKRAGEKLTNQLLLMMQYVNKKVSEKQV